VQGITDNSLNWKAALIRMMSQAHAPGPVCCVVKKGMLAGFAIIQYCCAERARVWYSHELTFKTKKLDFSSSSLSNRLEGFLLGILLTLFQQLDSAQLSLSAHVVQKQEATHWLFAILQPLVSTQSGSAPQVETHWVRSWAADPMQEVICDGLTQPLDGNDMVRGGAALVTLVKKTNRAK
jgi:hypothetical protein